MTDLLDAVPVTADPAGIPMRVAIVGAGVSGVITARTLTAVGAEVTVFEQAPDVGGVWSASRAYPGIATQDDRHSYTYSGRRMPAHAAEHPAGADVRAYLAEHLLEAVPASRVRLSTRVLRADQLPDATWRVESEGPDERRTEDFDWLVAANGVFSRPHVPAWPGRDAFEAAGGRVLSPGALGDGGVLDGARTVVVGWGKTACDVAAHASTRSASTAIVARTLTWKYPKRLGLAGLTFHHLVLTRAGERLIGTRYRSTTGRLLLRRVPERIPRVLLGRLIARAVDRTSNLTALGLLPDTEVRTSNSLVTDGFFEGVEDGRIRVHRERSIARLGADEEGPWVELSDGARLPADVVVAATGYEQGVDFLAPAVLERATTPEGALLLHERVLAVDVPRLAFVGWAHTFRSPLTSEIAAVWLAGVMTGAVRLPSAARMRRHAAPFPVSTERAPDRRTASLPPVSLRELDEVLRALGVALPASVRRGQVWRPVDPADYAAPLAAALARMPALRSPNRASTPGGRRDPKPAVRPDREPAG